MRVLCMAIVIVAVLLIIFVGGGCVQKRYYLAARPRLEEILPHGRNGAPAQIVATTITIHTEHSPAELESFLVVDEHGGVQDINVMHNYFLRRSTTPNGGDIFALDLPRPMCVEEVVLIMKKPAARAASADAQMQVRLFGEKGTVAWHGIAYVREKSYVRMPIQSPTIYLAKEDHLMDNANGAEFSEAWLLSYLNRDHAATF